MNDDAGAPNIVLTGFMGTGKSTVGRVLAHRSGREFVDTDVLIEARHGAIPEIFAERGEAAFRELEHEVARELSARRGLVVATGGRLLLDHRNAEALGATGHVFCLAADADEIVRRVVDIDGAADRPLLAGPDPAARVRALLDERRSGYGAFEQVETTGRTPNQIAIDILERLAH